MRRRNLLAAGLAGAFALLAVLDILREPPPRDLPEILLDLAEKALILGAMVLVAWTVAELRELGAAQQALADRQHRADAEGGAWRDARATEIAALGDAIAAEFRAWGLSPAEADVAGLLLKGMSMKEIALARRSAEATIRQQAQVVYQKAGLRGRAELSAYFLDSLFAEAEDRRLRLVPGDRA